MIGMNFITATPYLTVNTFKIATGWDASFKDVIGEHELEAAKDMPCERGWGCKSF